MGVKQQSCDKVEYAGHVVCH